MLGLLFGVGGVLLRTRFFRPVAERMPENNSGPRHRLVLASVASVYVAVFVVHWAWTSDVRIWTFNIKPLTPRCPPVYLSYVGPFFVFLLGVSTVVFVQLRPRVATLGRFMTTVTAILVVGYVALIDIEYGGLWATGQLMTATQPLLAIVAFQAINTALRSPPW